MRWPLTTPEGGTPREAGPRALARLPPKAELVIIHLRVTLTPNTYHTLLRAKHGDVLALMVVSSDTVLNLKFEFKLIHVCVVRFLGFERMLLI